MLSKLPYYINCGSYYDEEVSSGVLCNFQLYNKYSIMGHLKLFFYMLMIFNNQDAYTKGKRMLIPQIELKFKKISFSIELG